MNATAQRAPRDHALRKLALEEADAWFEYLEACQRAGDRYDVVEPWSWTRLSQRLRAVGARRRSLQRRAAA